MNTIEQEKNDAEAKYGHFNSTHEVYAVLLEEVDEFWDLVKQPTASTNYWDDDGRYLEKKDKMVRELTQIAAIAQRAAQEIENKEIRWI
jgi:TfoX/Sxy family transcriptional regulator of competence genes